MKAKNVIYDYYRKLAIINGTQANHSDVLISSKDLDSEVSLIWNEKFFIQNAASCLRNEILDF